MENYEKVNILLVDDNPANLLAQEAVLAELGQNLVCVNSGKEALKHLLEKDFAVILLDVSMPEMDGFELAELIRHRPSSAHIPIIFITALAMTEIEREKGCSLGAVDYIFSPVSPEILRAKVSVFVDMFRMQREVKRHAEELTELDQILEKHLEDVERLNQQLESANKELESFSYSVSHDLRNPLTVISLSSQMLMIGYADKLDEKGRDCVSRIQKATQRMTELIEALLALSRLKQQEIKSESVDLSTVTDAIARELKERDPDRQIEFIVEKGVITNGDGQFLQITMENLLGNAYKFTSKKPQSKIEFGVMSLESRGKEAGGRGQDGKAIYFVRDNGVGFDCSQADKLFTAFSRLHPASEFSGIGIGLATVQRIICRHNGRIWAEGKPNEGATFYWTLG